MSYLILGSGISALGAAKLLISKGHSVLLYDDSPISKEKIKLIPQQVQVVEKMGITKQLIEKNLPLF